jgi:16S rRNA (uracil1498-N3)-methyltransferase
MKRIFYEGKLNSIIEIEGDYFHYLKNVIRAKAGDRLGILTVDEFAECTITEMGKRNGLITVDTKRPIKEHSHRLKVYQCLLKREYMDFAVEKYTELGATEIVPVISDRSLNDLKDKTMQRFIDISVKAALQSENEQLPIISDAIDIKDVMADAESNVLFYERCEEKGGITPSKDMSIIIGPEGGFTDEEYAMLAAKGFVPVRPIEQILKAETASVVFTGYIRILQETI